MASMRKKEKAEHPEMAFKAERKRPEHVPFLDKLFFKSFGQLPAYPATALEQQLEQHGLTVSRGRRS